MRKSTSTSTGATVSDLVQVDRINRVATNETISKWRKQSTDGHLPSNLEVDYDGKMVAVEATEQEEILGKPRTGA
jgi:hypothetical protein